MTNRTDRTEALLLNYKGNRDEFMMLKGILCATHGLNYEDTERFNKFFDTALVAARMDQMNADALAAFHAEQRKQGA